MIISQSTKKSWCLWSPINNCSVMILVVFLWFPVLLWSVALLCHALLLMLSYCVNFPTFQCFSVPFPSPILSLSAWLQLYLNHLLVCSEARASFCLCQFFSVLPLCNPPVCFSSPVKCLPVFSIVSLFCPVVCFCYFFPLVLNWLYFVAGSWYLI